MGPYPSPAALEVERLRCLLGAEREEITSGRSSTRTQATRRVDGSIKNRWCRTDRRGGGGMPTELTCCRVNGIQTVRVPGGAGSGSPNRNSEKNGIADDHRRGHRSSSDSLPCVPGIIDLEHPSLFTFDQIVGT